MIHLNEGTLRRMRDEPETTSAADAAHFEACADCRRRAAEVGDQALSVSTLLAVPDAAVEPRVALLRVRRMAGDGTPSAGPGWFDRVRASRGFRPLAAGTLTLGLMGGLMATGVAEKAVQVFEPRNFAVVSVNPASLGSLPDLSQFGTYSVSSQPKFSSAATPAGALLGSGLTAVLTPSGKLPPSVKGAPLYETFTVAQGSFTIRADKARQYAATQGKSLPAMPSGLEGTTLTASAGPGVLTVYGAPPGTGTEPATEATASASDKPAHHGLSGLSIPTLAIVQMTTPKVSSDGAPVQAIERYIASLPGVPSELANQVLAIGDPAATLPVPVPTGQGSHPVDINGSHGLFVGDSTGLGAGVIWQRGGVLYAVVGTLNESEVVGIARSLR